MSVTATNNQAVSVKRLNLLISDKWLNKKKVVKIANPIKPQWKI